PTAGVDGPGQQRLNELIARQQRERGLTVLMVSHDVAVVSRYATAVLGLGRKRAFFGTTREILTSGTLHEIYGVPVSVHSHDD
ncbi:MAG TPA: hypothetical protein VHU82_15150, partial [Vicinamibacterales bacterium]|nr:hypothetical protein [Vicinamibacterales bacterium]